MNCREIKDRLSAYQDGELAAEKSGLVERHFKDCPACRAELELLEAAWRALEESLEIEPPPTLWSSLLKRIEKPEQGRRFWEMFSRLAPLPAAAAVLVVGLALGTMLGHNISSDIFTEETNGLKDALALSAFDDLPAGSLGDAYLSYFSGGERNEN